MQPMQRKRAPMDLREMSLVKIATSIWDNTPRTPYICSSGQIWWSGAKKAVQKKMGSLPLPTRLKKKLVGYVEMSGTEIYSWMIFHRLQDIVIPGLVDRVVWSQRGRIEKRKTVDALLVDDDSNVYERFKLACLHCSEPQVTQLWNKLSENEKKKDSNKPLVNYWKSVLCNNREFTLPLFPLLFTTCNELSLCYFFGRLNRELQLSVIRDGMSIFRHLLVGDMMNRRYIANCLFGVLMLMTEEDRRVVIRDYNNYTIRLLPADWFM